MSVQEFQLYSYSDTVIVRSTSENNFILTLTFFTDIYFFSCILLLPYFSTSSVILDPFPAEPEDFDFQMDCRGTARLSNRE